MESRKVSRDELRNQDLPYVKFEAMSFETLEILFLRMNPNSPHRSRVKVNEVGQRNMVAYDERLPVCIVILCNFKWFRNVNGFDFVETV